jgi:hypothetical protein
MFPREIGNRNTFAAPGRVYLELPTGYVVNCSSKPDEVLTGDANVR